MSASAPEVVIAKSSAPPPARILVVDDQPANIQIVGSALGRLGHEIVPASDGATALRRLSHRLPDLILLDLFMPEMDGCEVCRRLKANPAWKDVPVIFLSAADDKDLVVRALEAGGVDYITKPFNQAELISRVRTQLTLKFARDLLRQLAEDKDELLGILAHDLKNHLGGMQMSAELLCDRINRADKADARSGELAENISNNSRQLLAFVNEFLANAAADHGISLKAAPLNLAAAAEAVVHQYEEAAQRKQIQLDLKTTGGEITALADTSALNQILGNLLSNALKFSPEGKSVSVTVTDGATTVECRIQDQGPGFSDEDKRRMFRRYARLSARPTAGEPSSGLGLSIVKKLVLAMHGELICESTPGKGAAFVVRLPKPLVS